MPLTVGSHLGSYEITAQLGAGGMGEVYRATDTVLKRQVALKVLPPEVANDPERVARFQREAEVLAALNHPNIAHLYGIEKSSGTLALVMELVEGPTLADRIAKGAIPLDEALPIAEQIAEALEAAHEQGIIHRDLKPANIKVREDGTVKVLDFGLAKALEPGASSISSSAAMTNSPTITSPAMMTGVGMLIGTAAYMSPEQARGKTADRRSDIWAFGVVLFEMVTSSRAFDGETIADTLALILTSEPAWRTLPADTPAALQRLLRRSFEKDAKRRLQAIGEARAQIEDLINGVPDVVDHPAIPSARSHRRVMVPWTIAAVAIAAGAAAILSLAASRASRSAPAVRLSAAPGTDVLVGQPGFVSIALSPDGMTLAVAGTALGSTTQQLFVRRLSQLEATPLQGTVNALNPFFSPDGQSIAFFADGKLKRVPTLGGSVTTIADAPNPRGGSWAEDGSIVFASNTSGTLSRVASSGGAPQAATVLADDEISHRWPQAVDGGKALLYSASRSTTSWDTASIVGFRVASGTRTIVQTNAYAPRYFPAGYLLFMRDGTEYGGPFDVARMEFKTPPVPVLEGVQTTVASGGVQLALAPTGTIVYVPGAGDGPAAPIVWMNRDGTTTPLRQTASDWSNPQISPDGSRLAIDIREATNTDVFVYDWGRDAPSRLTFTPSIDEKPIWSPDGRYIVFASARDSAAGVTNLYLQRADGASEPQRLTTSTNSQLPGSWHPSGRFLAFTEIRPGTREDLMTLPMEGDDATGWKPGQPTAFLNTPAAESEPVFSPDGRWIAYQSNQGGTTQLFVRAFPGPGGMWQVSTDGGTTATWSHRTPEILFRPINARGVMATSYTVDGESFVANPPKVWAAGFLPTRPRQRSFDVDRDGNRIVAAPALPIPPPDKAVFVFNFLDELRRLAGTK